MVLFSAFVCAWHSVRHFSTSLACERAAKSTRYSLARLTLALLPLRDDYLACGGCVRAVLLLRIRTYVNLRRERKSEIERDRDRQRGEKKVQRKRGKGEREICRKVIRAGGLLQNQIFDAANTRKRLPSPLFFDDKNVIRPIVFAASKTDLTEDIPRLPEQE